MVTVMPDIAHHGAAQTEGMLNWVGMSNIELPVLLTTQGEPQKQVQTRAQAFVDINDPKAKGIHMSRLFLLLDELSTEDALSTGSILRLLDNFITSHKALSNNAYVQFDFDYDLRRRSLLSGKAGWRSYPVSITAEQVDGHISLNLNIKVTYSSTCPCSAALSRQLIQQTFAQHFADQQMIDKQQIQQWLGTAEGIMATPHSQRSTADVKVKLDAQNGDFPITALIDEIEAVLQTPVQAAVKREDEQEFARLNGNNPMFCEDAARKLQYILERNPLYSDFWLRVNHYESLHAHDAVSIATKGVPGGFRP